MPRLAGAAAIAAMQTPTLKWLGEPTPIHILYTSEYVSVSVYVYVQIQIHMYLVYYIHLLGACYESQPKVALAVACCRPAAACGEMLNFELSAFRLVNRCS